MKKYENVEVEPVMEDMDDNNGSNGSALIIPQIVVDVVKELQEMDASDVEALQIGDKTAWTVESAEKDQETGEITITTTEFQIVEKPAVSPQEKEEEEQPVDLRAKRRSTEDETKEFYQAMERQRREIISVQRRSTPSDLETYQASALQHETLPSDTMQTNAMPSDNSRLEISSFTSADPGFDVEDDKQSAGAVERHSIIENKENTKRFLINRMQSEQTASDSLTGNDDGLKSRKKTTTLHVNISVPNDSSLSNGYQNGVVANDDNRVYVVEARPCFIEREVPKPGKIAAMSTHNIIAREIEECRQREEELKQLRHEVYVQELSTPSPIPQTPTVVFSPAALQMRMGVSTTNGYFENDFQQQTLASSDGDPFDEEDKEMNGQFPSIEDTRIKVRPLVDESDEDEVPFYKTSSESAVEKDIRLAKEREEELRREKEAAAQKLPRPKSNDDADANVSTSTLNVVLSPNSSPALTPLVIQTSDQSEHYARTETLLLMKAAPVDEQPRSPSVESQIHSSSSSTVSFVPTSPSPQTNVSKKRSLASARLQQEIKEVLQKELELREAGAIATTSQDRTDDKVISLRQYTEISVPKPVPSLSQSVPTSAPPLSSTQFFPNVRNATPDYKPQGGTLGRQNSAGMKNSPNMGVHSSLPRGAMAKFIASRGKCQPMSVFVPKVPKEPLLPVEAATVTPPPSQQQRTQELRDSTEKAAYRRSLSTVESKILEELKEMKFREEELRKLRINSKSGSLETLDGDSSSETSGHAELHIETRTEVTNGHC